MENNEKPKKTYECKSCGGIIKANLDTPEESINCLCGKPKLVLLSYEDDGKGKERLNEIYELIVKTLKYYVDMPEDYYTLVAIWIIGTYFHEQFDTYPYLFFNAMRGSGKSRTLRLISTLSAKGDGSILNNVTESVLFRTPRGTTTCIDEIEQIGSKEKQTLRELLNSAYKKGIKVKRMKKVKDREGEKYVEESFEPYFPIAMANIWGIEEVLADRSITLILEKSNNPLFTKVSETFHLNDLVIALKPLLEVLKTYCCCYSYCDDVTLGDIVTLGGCIDNVINEGDDRGKTVNVTSSHHHIITSSHHHTNNNNNNNNKSIYKKWDKYIKEKYERVNLNETFEVGELEQFFNKIDGAGINGRNFELCFPLLLVANMLNDELFVKMLSILKDIVKEKTEEEYSDSRDVSLYDFVVQDGKDEFYPLKEYTSHFRLFVGDTGSEEFWVNEKWFGKALKRLKLIKDKIKRREGAFVKVNIEKAKEKLKIFKQQERSLEAQEQPPSIK